MKMFAHFVWLFFTESDVVYSKSDFFFFFFFVVVVDFFNHRYNYYITLFPFTDGSLSFSVSISFLCKCHILTFCQI